MEIRKNIVKTVHEAKETQILYHEIEPNQLCRREIILRVEMKFKKNTFFFTVLFIFVYLKQVPKYLATGLKRPSGTYSPPAEASTQG
jgi:hypothetical protein